MNRYGKALAVIEEDGEKDYGPNGGFTAILSTPSLDRDGDKLSRKEWIEPLGASYPLDIDHGMSVVDTVGSFTPYFEDDVLKMDARFSSLQNAQNVRTLIDEGHIRSVSVAFMTDKSKKDGEPRRELLNAGIVAIPSNRDAVILASKAYAALQDALPTVSVDERREIFASEGDDTGEEEKSVRNLLLDALVPEYAGQIAGIGTAGLLETLAPDKPKGITVNVVPKLDMKAVETLAADIKAALSPGGGGDAALTQAIHDASVHLGAICIQLVPDIDPTGAADGANKDVDADEVDTKDAEAETATAVPELTLVGSMTMEQFKVALSEVLTPQQDSPVDAPAETAAASDEEPAPVEDAAAETAEDVVDPTQRLLAMSMDLSATHQFTL